MPTKDKNQSHRQRKKEKQTNMDINGKYSSKYVRMKKALLEKQKVGKHDEHIKAKK
jgi:hypothetical protein